MRHIAIIALAVAVVGLMACSGEPEATTETTNNKPVPEGMEPPKKAEQTGESDYEAKKDADKAGTKEEGKTVKTSSGLEYEDLKVGTGAEAAKGQVAQVHYKGTLTNGQQFDSSWDRGQAFSFTIGAGEVIKGWDEGVAGMKVGGKRKLIVPPELGYGSRDMGAIPPNSVLIFEVDLLALR